jgi:hypothetical protein
MGTEFGQNFGWTLIIREGRLTIGCQTASFGEWFWRSDKEINDLFPGAPLLWHLIKDPLFQVIEGLRMWQRPQKQECVDDSF